MKSGTLTARHHYSGFSDYRGGYSCADNEYLLHTYYGRNSTIQDIVDELVQDAFRHYQKLPKCTTDDDVRKALVDMLSEQDRANYASGALANCSAAYAKATAGNEDYESPCFVVILDYVPDKIVVILGDGGVQGVENIPDGYTVEVRDYDVPDDWEDAECDEQGNRYQPVEFGG